jgi:hypothetical protein
MSVIVLHGGWASGLSITATAYYDDDGTMTLREAVAMSEEPVGSFLYKAIFTELEIGDIIKFTEPTGYVNFMTYGNTEVMLNTILTTTNKLDNMIVEDSAGNYFTTIALRQFMELAGFTIDDELNVRILYRLLAAWMAGNWRQKPGSVDPVIYQNLDVNGTDVLLEQTVNIDSPYKEVTIVN